MMKYLSLLLLALIFSISIINSDALAQRTALEFEAQPVCPIDILDDAFLLSTGDFQLVLEDDVTMLTGGCGNANDACNCAVHSKNCKNAEGVIQKCLCWAACNIACRNVPPGKGTFPNGEPWEWTGECE